MIACIEFMFHTVLLFFFRHGRQTETPNFRHGRFQPKDPEKPEKYKRLPGVFPTKEVTPEA